jgi:AAA15 family ATPase/GTPase
MMRLIAFRIRNFRSIVDTEWQNLSPDNITCLIGQNESGKTSVLEALGFHSGIISEDVLRAIFIAGSQLQVQYSGRMAS